MLIEDQLSKSWRYLKTLNKKKYPVHAILGDFDSNWKPDRYYGKYEDSPYPYSNKLLNINFNVSILAKNIFIYNANVKIKGRLHCNRLFLYNSQIECDGGLVSHLFSCGNCNINSTDSFIAVCIDYTRTLDGNNLIFSKKYYHKNDEAKYGIFKSLNMLYYYRSNDSSKEFKKCDELVVTDINRMRLLDDLYNRGKQLI